MAVLLIFSTLLSAQSLREKEHYEYIVELYYSDVYLEEVLPEMDAFRGQFPNSSYLQNLDYLRANLALKQGDYRLSQSMYAELLKQDLHPDILADVYLNFAVSCYYTGDYQRALGLLDELLKNVSNSYFNYQARVWRGRIQSAQGFYLSAELEYVLALQDDPDEVRYDYFLILLKLDRFEEALALLEATQPEQDSFTEYHSSWLSYLLTQGLYDEFDAHLGKLLEQPEFLTEEMRLLQVRKALELEEYPTAAALLDSLDSKSKTKIYYQAVLLKHTGQTAQADSLFRGFLRSPDRELAYLSYLERLKILYADNPAAAIRQLGDFLQDPNARRGEAYHLLGVFHFDQGSFRQALHYSIEALDYELTGILVDDNDARIAEAYYQTDAIQYGLDAYNRYLNYHPQGKYRDRALFRLGMMNYLRSDHRQARLNLQRLLREHPGSPWSDEAKFYLAELHFLASEYADAARLLNDIALSEKNYPTVFLRLAQTYYYQDKFTEALRVLETLPESAMDFDATVLLAGISFSRKDYERALAIYEQASGLASTPHQKTEALSYRAYTLYYMKKYDEASSLYYDLATGGLNADIYLFQAAKAAAQGKQWQRALDLYDRFLEDFPESEHYLQALAGIANTQYNLGAYDASLETWLNLLRRFTAHTSVADAELVLLNEAFTGIEISCRQLNAAACIERISEVIETFRSDYIKFELEYLLVKLYADAELWSELLSEASALRGLLNLPQSRRDAIELLMLESLVKLDQYGAADSLASQIHSSSPSRELLIKWAELAVLTGNAELALDRYLEAFQMSPEPDLWLRMLDLSTQNGFIRFGELWDQGQAYHSSHPQGKLNQIEYFFHTGDLLTAAALADSILDSEPNPWFRARSEYWLGRIAFESGDHSAALRSFRKIRLLHKDLPDVYIPASYHYIVCLINLEALQEAQLTFDEVRDELSAEQVRNIRLLLEERR
ncbi:MAG: tetratricopeptide repeat protein [Candidatus Syntrophosphaera sp.]|nr:tetratricopeptide repeat protein [Candidatus Syntrophosphaera sp.]